MVCGENSSGSRRESYVISNTPMFFNFARPCAGWHPADHWSTGIARSTRDSPSQLIFGYETFHCIICQVIFYQPVFQQVFFCIHMVDALSSFDALRIQKIYSCPEVVLNENNRTLVCQLFQGISDRIMTLYLVAPNCLLLVLRIFAIVGRLSGVIRALNRTSFRCNLPG